MIYLKYLWSLLRHKWYVFVAGGLCKVPFWRRVFHDWSKFSPTEFGRYARHNIGGNKDRREWAIAWHHHQLLNGHHPEHWLLTWTGDPDYYVGIGEPVAEFVVALPMPAAYVQELVADHLGAARARTGSWDASRWFNENGPRWVLHPLTRVLIGQELAEIGFFGVSNFDWSWMASSRFHDWAERH